MRKPNSICRKANVRASNCAVAVAAILLGSVTLCGCSQLQKPASFEPMPQPKSLTERQQRPVEEILARQDELRMAAEQNSETEAAREEFQVAQVSYDSELDDEARELEATAEQSTEQPTVQESAFSDSTKTTKPESSVKLIAQADDFEGVPFNFARDEPNRDEVDFSTANFLRPRNDFGANLSTATEMQQTAVDDASEDPPVPFGNAESLQLPLPPMLFNPGTRAKKSILEGTLRPLSPGEPEIEPEVAVDREIPDVTIVGDIETDTNFGPLTPLRDDATMIVLESHPEPQKVEHEPSTRLLAPTERAPNEIVIAPTMESPAEEAVTGTYSEIVAKETAPAPEIVSEQIIVIDPSVETPAIASAATDATSEPIVDESVAHASADYLVPMAHTSDGSDELTVPREVLEDAIVVAEDIEREMTASAIPSEEADEEDNNDFKVQPASNTTVTSVCSGCNSENCTGCETQEQEPGEPMFTNNDFAAPVTPGGDFVAPMAVAPAEVPKAIPGQMSAASSNFGNPVDLDPPAETDLSSVSRIASLPVEAVNVSPEALKSSVPPVGLSTIMELSAVTWKSRLDEAIELVEGRLNQVNNPSDASLVNLRLLKAIRNQMEEIEDGTAGSQTENESQYWQHQLDAITSMLGAPSNDNKPITDYHRHQAAHETLAHLRHAVAELESIASLKITSGQFCTEITGFGQFKVFPSTAFSPGQKMLVYCEVENYKTIEQPSATGNDFRTRLRGSYAIYDASGKVVQQAEFPTVEDLARKRRRDFYMYMPVTLGELPAGQYVLHALVEDVYGKKTASLDPPLTFSVK